MRRGAAAPVRRGRGPLTSRSAFGWACTPGLAVTGRPELPRPGRAPGGAGDVVGARGTGADLGRHDRSPRRARRQARWWSRSDGSGCATSRSRSGCSSSRGRACPRSSRRCVRSRPTGTTSCPRDVASVGRAAEVTDRHQLAGSRAAGDAGWAGRRRQDAARHPARACRWPPTGRMAPGSSTSAPSTRTSSSRSSSPTALGVPSRGDDRWSEVLEHLADKQALVILDNCEAAVDGLRAAARRAAGPLSGMRGDRHEPGALGTPREDQWRVEPLEVVAPDGGQGAGDRPLPRSDPGPTRALPSPCPSSSPWSPRSAGGSTGFRSRSSWRRRGMAVISPQELLDGLRDRFQVLRSHDPTIPERQRTLEALLDWSDRLLAPGERTCLRRLGVFGGSFSVDAATAAAAGRRRRRVRRARAALVARRQVAGDPRPHGQRHALSAARVGAGVRPPTPGRRR